jgi:hypothetical protein
MFFGRIWLERRIAGSDGPCADCPSSPQVQCRHHRPATRFRIRSNLALVSCHAIDRPERHLSSIPILLYKKNVSFIPRTRRIQARPGALSGIIKWPPREDSYLNSFFHLPSLSFRTVNTCPAIRFCDGSRPSLSAQVPWRGSPCCILST